MLVCEGCVCWCVSGVYVGVGMFLCVECILVCKWCVSWCEWCVCWCVSGAYVDV